MVQGRPVENRGGSIRDASRARNLTTCSVGTRTDCKQSIQEGLGRNYERPKIWRARRSRRKVV